MSSPAPSTTPSRCRPRASRSSRWSSSDAFRASCWLLPAKAAAYRRPADLKGMKIGVTAPGSSTHFMVRISMAQAGLKDDDAAFIGVGAGATAVAAAERGEIDALVSVDPVINLLESENAIRIVADTRTLEGTRQVYRRRLSGGGALSHPGLRAKQSQDRAVAGQRVGARPEVDRQPFRPRTSPRPMPPEYALGNMDAVHPLDPQQHADVFAGRPVQPRRAPRQRSRCCASSTTACSERQDRSRAPTYTDAFVDKASATRDIQTSMIERSA